MNIRMLGIAAAAGLAGSVCAQSVSFVRVQAVKTNCNLRAKPLVTSEVVGQVSAPELLAAKTLGPDWVEVVPPAGVDVWVLGDYVTNGLVRGSRTVNVRAGPGINFSIIGHLSPGDRVEVRGAHADWVKLAPLPNCSAWIARELVQPVAPAGPAAETPPVREPEPDREAVAAPAAEAAVPDSPPAGPPDPAPPLRPDSSSAPSPAGAPPPTPAPKDPGTVFYPPPDLALVPSTAQGRWREVEGVLLAKDFLARAPSDFRLVAVESGDSAPRTVCFVKGNHAQLKALLNRYVVIGGREYWVRRQKYPVLVPERIRVR